MTEPNTPITLHERIKHIVEEIEHAFGFGHPLATAVVDQAVENGQVAVTDPNPEPGKLSDSIVAPPPSSPG